MVKPVTTHLTTISKQGVKFNKNVEAFQLFELHCKYSNNNKTENN